ncbi:S-adenosyl-L-methionine-dependent methyltransferase [Hypoxylon cercidicola]|nr:S-adenosyl-L-methionine-dependent methyltransferase [Hypoxylon cercidicola]
MESILLDLIDSLKSASLKLNGNAKNSLQTALHDTEKLPDRKLSSLASETLDLLSEIRLLLEPGHLILADHFLGYMNTKALCTAVEMGIPDILHSGPKTLPELARECDARPDRLRQVMRALHNNSIFSYDAGTDTYENNHTSTLIMSDHWTQWRNWVELYGNEFYDMARGIPPSCKKDATRSPAQINFNTNDSMFKYFSDKGWVPKFHKTLSGGAIAQAPGILQDYPWEEVAACTVVDVGGGGGGLIALLLREYKTMTGSIFETPNVIEQARSNFHDPKGQYADVGNRIPPDNLIAGDFFQDVPPSEVYIMKWCLHDWNDEKARIILRNIRRALRKGPHSRLVILESVLKDGHMGRMSRYGDLNMMVAVGGREREEKQWRKLANETGWELRRICPLRNAWPCAIEFVPVWEPTQVTADMRFLEPWDVKRGNPFIRINPAPGYDRMNFNWQDYPVKIQDARSNKESFTLDTNGFAYFEDDISQDMINALRGNDKGIVQELYYPHVEQFVKRLTNAPRIIIFDHTLRKRRLDLGKTQNDDGKEQPATMVHCDQSEKGALRRLKMNISDGENIDELLQGRVQMINVWRPLNGPVMDWPLATMDYQTVKPSEMHPCDLLKEKDEERGQTATFTSSEEQKWYYLDKQKTNEVTVIKIWDSKTDGVSKFCAHAAFNHPDAPPDVEPRESVEVRCLVIH